MNSFFTYFFQDFESRSHVTIYLPVASHEAQVKSKEDKSVKQVRTDLVVTVSNWRFNRDAQKNPDEVECRPNDCYVGLKYSSTAFAGKNRSPEDLEKQQAGSLYFFDKYGLSVTYSAFVNMISDTFFLETYLADIRKTYEEKEKKPLPGGDDSGFEDCENEEGAYPEDSAGSLKRVGKGKKTAGSKRARFVEEEDQSDEGNNVYDNGVPSVDDSGKAEPSTSGKASRRSKHV